MKKIIIIVIGVIFTLLACAVVAPFVINLNKYKGKIIELAKPYLPRDFDFGSVELTIMQGLGMEIRDLRIGENPKFGEGDFLKLERLRVKLEVLPLLKKHIRVKELALDKPAVRLVKNARGEFNFQDITTSSVPPKQHTQKMDGGGAAPGGETKGGSAILAGFLVSNLVLNEARIDYIDESASQGASKTTIDLLDLRLTDVSLNRPIQVYMAACLPGSTRQNATLKGTLGPLGDSMDMKRLSLDATVSLQEVELGNFTSYLPAGLPVKPVQGTADMDISIQGSIASGISSEGEIHCEDLVVAGTDGRMAVGKTTLTLQEKIDFVLDEGTVDIGKLDVKIGESAVSITGRVEEFSSKPKWDVTLKAQNLSADMIFAFYPSVLNTLPKDTSISGTMGMDLVSKGDMDDLDADATMTMNDMEIAYGDTFHKPKSVPLQIAMKANKSGDVIQLNPMSVALHTMKLTAFGKITGLSSPQFDFLVGTNDVSCQGWGNLVPQIKDYGLDGTIVLKSSLKGSMDDAAVQLEISSPRVEMAFASKESDPSKNVFESFSMKAQVEKKQDSVRGDGSLEINKVEMMSSSFDGIQAEFNYRDNSLDINKFAAHALQGDVSMTGSFDLNRLFWNVKPVITNVDVQEAIDTFTRYKGIMKGKLSGSFVASGPVTNLQTNAIDAGGAFKLEEGEITHTNLVDTVIEALGNLKGISEYLAAEIEKRDTQKATQFDSMDGDFAMSRGVVALQKLDLHNIHTAKSSDSQASFQGQVNLDAGNLNLKGKITLSQEQSAKLAKKAEPLSSLLTPDNYMILPITITGSLSRPIPFLDTSYVLAAVAKYYGKKELEKLSGKIVDKIGLPTKDEKEQTKGGKEPKKTEKEPKKGSPLGDFLKGILKK